MKDVEKENRRPMPDMQIVSMYADIVVCSGKINLHTTIFEPPEIKSPKPGDLWPVGMLTKK
jgi:hypothetical protein